MHLRYTWEPEEWREALLLASAGPRRPPKPVMIYAVVCMMSLGAVGELFNALRSSVAPDYSGSLLPMLLFAAAVVVAMQVYTRAASRNRALRPLAAMPDGEQELLLSEGGWRAVCAGDLDAGQMRSWGELRERRMGQRSMIMVGRGNAFAAVPLRALTATQGSHLHRLLVRKFHRETA